MKHIDHIGIAVRDIDEAIAAYERLLNAKCYKRETIEEQRVETAFFETDESKVELLGATVEDSVIAQYLQKKAKACTTLLLRLKIFGLKSDG